MELDRITAVKCQTTQGAPMFRSGIARTLIVLLAAGCGRAPVPGPGAPPGEPPAPMPMPMSMPAPAAGVRIHQIQGVAHLSPLAGQTVGAVPGIVTIARANGFYLQDP